MAIRESLELVDNMSPTLKKIHADMVRAQNDLKKYRKLEMDVVNKQLHWAKVAGVTSKEIALGKKLATMQTRYYSEELKRQINLEKRANNEVARGNNLRRSRGGSNMFNSSISSFNRLTSTLANIAFMSSGAMGAMNSVIEPYSNYISNRNRINLLNDGSMSTNDRFQSLIKTANKSRMGADAFISLYNRIGMSGVKTTNAETQRFTELVGKTLSIAGTGTQENRGVMLQLAQGLGSNMLSGDELRTIREQAPVLMNMLARGLKVSTGELKKLGKEGKLTARTVMDALMSMGDEIDKMAEKAPWTMGQVMDRIKNTWEANMPNFAPFYNLILDSLKSLDIYLQSDKGTKFLTDLSKCAYEFGQIIVGVGRIVFKVFTWMIEHIDKLQLLLKALGVVFGVVFINKGIDAITEVIKGFKAMEASAIALNFRLGLTLALLMSLIELSRALSKNKEYEDSRTKNIMKLGYTEDQAKGIKGSYDRYSNAISTRGIKLDKKTHEWVYVTPGGSVLKSTRELDDLKRNYKNLEAYAKLKGISTSELISNIANNDIDLGDSYSGDYGAIIQKSIEKQAQLDKVAKGMLDPTKNKVPNDVNNVKNVENVSGDIKLDAESLEMMKNIAERQWTIMNNIEVPQNINNHITNNNKGDWGFNLDDLTNGIKTATVASLAGGVV